MFKAVLISLVFATPLSAMDAAEASARQTKALFCANAKDWECAHSVLTDLVSEPDFSAVVTPQVQEIVLLNYAASAMYAAEPQTPVNARLMVERDLETLAHGFPDGRRDLAGSMMHLLRAESCHAASDVPCALESLNELARMKDHPGWNQMPLKFLKRSDGVYMRDVLAQLEMTYEDRMQ